MKKIALLLVAAPLVLAACGGSSNAQVNADPLAYVKHAASKTVAMRSEHMVMTGSVYVGANSVKVSGSGDFSNTTKQGRMTATVSLMGQNIRMDEIVAGTTVYMRSPLFSSHLPTGKTWLKLDLQKFGQSKGIDYSSLMSQSPEQGLQRLEAAGSVERLLGTETVDGVKTTHYQVTNLDISKLPQGAKVLALAHPTYGPIDVWIGNSDGYVYRESMSFSYSVKGRSASMVATVNLSKFGEAVHVDVPAASEAFDVTSLAGAGAGG